MDIKFGQDDLESSETLPFDLDTTRECYREVLDAFAPMINAGRKYDSDPTDQHALELSMVCADFQNELITLAEKFGQYLTSRMAERIRLAHAEGRLDIEISESEANLN
ncbi:MAG: hypothetical protein K0U72_05615 [Gammaproteobacteria bacterium]|nr:hypothetical protein [Gammaproteobacteria bacterium]